MTRMNRLSQPYLTGQTGESVATSYLRAEGYTILATNWRYRHYELDIVATDGCELVVVEVKTRAGNPLLPPEAAIDRHKIARLAAAADAYVQRGGIDMPVRFDVVCLSRCGTTYTVEAHIEDAFYAPLNHS